MPCSSRCMSRPLKRMTVGMVLAAIAFVCAALVQLEIDVSRKAIYLHTAQPRSTFEVKYMLFCFGCFPENFADLPVILTDSVKISEHEPKFSECFTAWTRNSTAASCKWGGSSHVSQSLDSFCRSDSVPVQQASDELTFTDENITISIGTPAVTQTIQLTKGLRQTLLIPSNLNENAALVS